MKPHPLILSLNSMFFFFFLIYIIKVMNFSPINLILVGDGYERMDHDSNIMDGKNDEEKKVFFFFFFFGKR